MVSTTLDTEEVTVGPAEIRFTKKRYTLFTYNCELLLNTPPACGTFAGREFVGPASFAWIVRSIGVVHSADHEQDWQPYPVDPYSWYM